MLRFFSYLSIVSGLLGLLATCSVTADDSASRHQQGRDIYNYRWYFCHGYSGDAKTLASSYLQPPPRDFTRSSPGELSRDAMIAVVTAGKTGTAMHGFSRLLDATEIAAVVPGKVGDMRVILRSRSGNCRSTFPRNK